MDLDGLDDTELDTELDDHLVNKMLAISLNPATESPEQVDAYLNVAVLDVLMKSNMSRITLFSLLLKTIWTAILREDVLMERTEEGYDFPLASPIVTLSRALVGSWLCFTSFWQYYIVLWSSEHPDQTLALLEFTLPAEEKNGKG